MDVKFCKDCKWSRQGLNEWLLRCTHSKVIANDPYQLARAEPKGKDASEARDKGWFQPCGISGKLWEPKCESQ